MTSSWQSKPFSKSSTVSPLLQVLTGQQLTETYLTFAAQLQTASAKVNIINRFAIVI